MRYALLYVVVGAIWGLVWWIWEDDKPSWPYLRWHQKVAYFSLWVGSSIVLWPITMPPQAWHMLTSRRGGT